MGPTPIINERVDRAETRLTEHTHRLPAVDDEREAFPNRQGTESDDKKGNFGFRDQKPIQEANYKTQRQCDDEREYETPTGIQRQAQNHARGCCGGGG